MQEISPVLSGKFTAADYTPAKVNFNLPVTSDAVDLNNTDATAATNAPAPIDPRRYSQFDRTASQVGDAKDFSFSDFLDMINPLEHIPVVSSVYRAIAGERIHPVSRIAGDILFGGAIGVASALIGGVGAIGDSVMESQTGHDGSGTMMAALFGEDKPEATTEENPVAVADAALANASATALPALQPVPPVSVASTTIENNKAVTSSNVASMDSLSATLAAHNTLDNRSLDSPALLRQAKAYPLSPKAFGGVLATKDDFENQNRIIGLSQGSHGMRLGNTIYTNRMMNGPHPLPVAQPTRETKTADSKQLDPTSSRAVPSVISALPEANSSSTSSAAPPRATNALPQNLIDDMVMMRGLSQYQGLAARQSPLGSTLDMRN